MPARDVGRCGGLHVGGSVQRMLLVWLEPVADVDVDVDCSGGGVALARASFGVGGVTGEGDRERSCCGGERARLKDAMGETRRVSGGAEVVELQYAGEGGTAPVPWCEVMAGSPGRRSLDPPTTLVSSTGFVSDDDDCQPATDPQSTLIACGLFNASLCMIKLISMS